MEKTALLIIDAQQEYFAPVGKMVLPDATTFAPGSPALEIYPVVAPKPKVLLLADATAAMDLKAADGSIIPHDQVHRTHLASLNGFLAQVTTTDQVVK
ncbi:MAG: hypothetical protein AABZ20_01540 [candidate division NC10 bacterium]